MNDRKQFSGPILVICAYKPHPGKENALLEVVKEHVPILQSLGLATSRPAHIMRSQDGTIVEVFEWASQKAIGDAHNDPTVLEMWKRFDDASKPVPVGELAESKHVYSDFEPV